MGCDYYADGNGEFEMEVWDYESPHCGEKIGTIIIKGLSPYHELGKDIIKGGAR